MQRNVILMRAYQQVIWAVIGLVAIDVMDDFRLWIASAKTPKRTTNGFLCDDDVFVSAFSSANAYNYIAMA